MKAIWSNQESRRGRSRSPEASRRGQGPHASYLTPGLPCLRAPSGVNFPPPEGGRTPRTPKNRSSSGSCHRRPPPGPPRSIHNPRPRPLQPFAPPAGIPEKSQRGCGPGLPDQGPSGLRPGPLPGNSNAPRERGGGRTLPGDGAEPPAETPASAPTRTRPLALTAAAPGSAERQAAAGGPRGTPATPAGRAAAEVPATATHRRPPYSKPPAAGRCGAASRVAGPRREAPGSSPRPAPRPHTPRVGTHVR